MFCTRCGTEVNEGPGVCPRCGTPVAAGAGQVSRAGWIGAEDPSPMSRLVTSLLAFFLGEFGVHHFYAGRIRTGAAMLAGTVVAYALVIGGIAGEAATAGDEPWWLGIAAGVLVGTAIGIWSLVDFIMAVSGNFRDSQGKIVRKW